MQSIVDRGASLGLDVGSLFVHGVLIDADGQILARESRPHHGEVARAVRQVAATLVHAAERLKPQETAGEQPAKAAQAAGVQAVGLVGPHAGKVASTLGLEVDDQVGATLRGVQRALPGARDIIDAGGSSLALLRVGPSGEFVGYQVNTLCAAGTGSFLDEQAERLGVSMEDMAHQPVMENPPDIATRCAVFAKSDLIHRQQEGHGKPALWDGLCRGLARTMIMTLFKGRTPAEPLGLVGGVARNPAVVKGLEHELGIRALCPDHPETVTALGAALGARPLQAPLDLDALHQETAAPTSHMARRRPLVLERSDYPSFQVTEEWEDEHGTEVRVSIPPTRGILEGTLGVDVGSTSTKLALVNDEGQVVLDLYRKTLGDPVGATRLLLKALETVAARHGARLRITGVGTTGSGRKLVGAVLGADKVVNEISAHVTGAMKVDPRIDTIFEIGGQDAKYIHTVDGRL